MKAGEILRAEREKRGLSLEDVENAIKIRVKYLDALENDAYHELPDEVYCLGFLRNYARFLELDPAPLVDYYKSQIKSDNKPISQITEQDAGEKKRKSKRKKPHTTLTLPVKKILGVAAVVIFAIIIIIFASSGARKQANFIPPPTHKEKIQQPQQQAPNKQEQGIIIQLVCNQECWTRVIADGEEQFANTLRPGDKKTFKAKDSIRIKMGNAGGIDIFYNGEKLPPIGKNGEVVEKEFTTTS